MTYIVLETSSNAIRLLNQQSLWSVHSIYRNTINLKGSDCLVSLQAKDTVLSPISIVLPLSGDEISSLNIHQDTLFFWDKDISSLSIGAGDSLKFEIDENTKLHNLDIYRITDNDSIGKLYFHIKSALEARNISPLGCFIIDCSPKSDDLIDQSIFKILNDVSINLEKLDYKEASLSLCQLIGLGKGLTPSGDDFICGLLACFDMLEKLNHPFPTEVLRQLPNYLQNTNDISKEFLKHAILGRYSLPVANLCKMNDAWQILKAFSSIGHSSGMDTLSGILFAMKVLGL